MSTDLQAVIEQAWDERDGIGFHTKGAVREAVDSALAQLDAAYELVAHATGPVVVDVAIDGLIRMPKLDRVAAMKPTPNITAFGLPNKSFVRLPN